MLGPGLYSIRDKKIIETFLDATPALVYVDIPIIIYYGVSSCYLMLIFQFKINTVGITLLGSLCALTVYILLEGILCFSYLLRCKVGKEYYMVKH